MLKGCDISHHQGTVNYQALKDNFDFVIVRATYGDGYKDTRFEVNRDGLRQTGVLLGFYHYAYPQYNAPEAEADWFTSVVSCRPGEIVVLDFEENYPTPVDWCKRFLDKVKSNLGFKPYLYINLALNNAQDWSPVVNAGYPLWLARWDYNPEATPPSTDWQKVLMRQYSNSGNSAGISPLDLNIFYGTANEFKLSGNPAPSTPDPTPDPTPNPPSELISFDQFFGKYDQKPVDFDGNAKYWCVDVYRMAVKEVLGFPQSPLVGSAYQIWDTYLTQYFDRIERTPTNAPIKGDFVIWGTEVGADGHTAICKDGDPNQLTSFDQNWPVGSLAHFQPHSYWGVKGWLRKREITQPPTEPTPPTELPTESVPPVNPCEAVEEQLALSEAEKIKVQTKFDNAKAIINGTGWWWVKYARLKITLNT